MAATLQRVWRMLNATLFLRQFQKLINKLFEGPVAPGNPNVDMILVCKEKPVSEDVALLLSLKGAVTENVGKVTSDSAHALIRSQLEKAGLQVAPVRSDSQQSLYSLVVPFHILAQVAEELGIQVPNTTGGLVPFSELSAGSGLVKDFRQDRLFFTSFQRQQVCEHLLLLERTAEGRSLLPLLMEEGLFDYYPVHDPAAIERVVKEFKRDTTTAANVVAAYFGTSRGFYFAWLDFYNWSLYLPAIMGLLLWFTQVSYEELSWKMLGYMVVLALWSSMFLEFWKRRSAELGYRWGVLDYETAEHRSEAQPSYYGEPRNNPITGKIEVYEEDWIRYRRYFITWPLSLICVLAAACLMWVSFLMEDWAVELQKQNYFSWSFVNDYIVQLPNIFYVLTIPISNQYYTRLAKDMTRWENHRTESLHQRNLILKLSLFCATNNYLSLFYCMFYVRDIQRLRRQFGSLMITTQFLGSLAENGPHIWAKLNMYWSKKKEAKKGPDPVVPKLCKRCRENVLVQGAHAQLNSLACDDCQASSPGAACFSCMSCGVNVCGQCHKDYPVKQPNSEMGETPELFDEYIEMALQFGYISLFGWCWPLAAVCCLLNNQFELRTDFFKLTVSRRPLPRHSGGIGIYQTVMEFLSVFAVVTNFASLGVYLFYLHEGQLFDLDLMTPGTLIVVLMVSEHVLIFVKLLIEMLIPDVPQWITDQIEKEKFETAALLHALPLELAKQQGSFPGVPESTSEVKEEKPEVPPKNEETSLAKVKVWQSFRQRPSKLNLN